MTFTQRLSNAASMMALPILVIAVWELAVRYEMVSTFLLPSFSQVVVRLYHEIASGEILRSAASTVSLLVISYVLAAIIGVVLGILDVAGQGRSVVL